MLRRDYEILGEVQAFCEMAECLSECACATEMVEDKEGHEHDAKGLFTHKGGGGHAQQKPASRGAGPGHKSKPSVRAEHRREREHKLHAKLRKLEKHEIRASHVFSHAAEGVAGGQEVLDAFEAAHGHAGEVAGSIIDFAALTVPHVRKKVDQYRHFLQGRYGQHGAKMILAAGSAIALTLKVTVPGAAYAPLANYFSSLPAVGIAEACRHAKGACGKLDDGITAIVRAAGKIPGVTPLAHGVGKAVGAYGKVKEKLERGTRHAIGKGASALGRGIGAMYRKIAGQQPAMAHAEEDDDPEGVLDEPDLDDATVQREAEKFAAYIIKSYKQLLDQHRDKLDKASAVVAQAAQGKGAGNAAPR